MNSVPALPSFRRAGVCRFSGGYVFLSFSSYFQKCLLYCVCLQRTGSAETRGPSGRGLFFHFFFFSLRKQGPFLLERPLLLILSALSAPAGRLPRNGRAEGGAPTFLLRICQYYLFFVKIATYGLLFFAISRRIKINCIKLRKKVLFRGNNSCNVSTVFI